LGRGCENAWIGPRVKQGKEKRGVAYERKGQTRLGKRKERIDPAKGEEKEGREVGLRPWAAELRSFFSFLA